MDYAINKLTNKVESADQATGSGLYMCPCCKAMMSFRAGTIRRKYFAHWPGWGTSECENFVPGQNAHNAESGVLRALTKRRMDLRLVIPPGGNRAAWLLELVLPSCRACDGTVTVDVGGRLKQFNMRGMTSGARAMVELSTENFRIVSFDGHPDPLFKDGVERECPGLPSSGAAVFTASGRGQDRGFPRAQEIRGAETYALLWKEAPGIDFPNELVLEWLTGRQGWQIALVTMPEKPSEECSQWLQSFTGLRVNPPVPYITPIWPFLTRNSSIHTVEYAGSAVILLSAHMMPMGQRDPGPTMQVFAGLDRISATGVERSPALFILTPEKTDTFRVGKTEHRDLDRHFTRAPSLEQAPQLPAVEAVFTDQDGGCVIIPLHQKKCQTLIAAVRAGDMTLNCLAMPPGTSGRLIVKRFSVTYETQLHTGADTASHNRRQRLLPAELQSTVITALIDPASHIDLDFYGFGRLRLLGNQTRHIAEPMLALGPNLRARLYSFICQLQAGSPIPVVADDHALVSAFSKTTPAPELAPHHRALVKKILACGFQLNI